MATLGVALFPLLCFGAIVAQAQPATSSFYAGKTVRLVVGYPPGSTFDNYARLASRHLGRHMPGNPTVVVFNMPGAGGLTATSYAAKAATADGLTLALINPSNTIEPLINPELAKFDARQFNWIGSMNTEVSTCAFWTDKVKNLEDLKRVPVTVGATGLLSGSAVASKVVENILGLNMKVVVGYPGLNEVRLAAENKEVDGFCGLQVSFIKTTLMDSFKNGGFHVVLQTGLEKHPDLPASIPNIFDLAPDQASRQILSLVFALWAYGAPIMAPPNTPEDRVAILRNAFDKMVTDPLFIEDTKNVNLESQPMKYDRISALVAEAYNTPKDVIRRTQDILGIERK
ncbi:MAG: tripartite tricarboxylate transporter family receptor [Hyphomicrobiales bacterium]|nr:tripartite tricarboxylate transporter family receptor [Hyphomicrobiales bacterium]